MSKTMGWISCTQKEYFFKIINQWPIISIVTNRTSRWPLGPLDLTSVVPGSLFAGRTFFLPAFHTSQRWCGLSITQPNTKADFIRQVLRKQLGGNMVDSIPPRKMNVHKISHPNAQEQPSFVILNSDKVDPTRLFDFVLAASGYFVEFQAQC